MMYWRQIRAAELSACLDLQPACIGDGLVGREAALRVWSELGASPAFHANVIESERPGMARRLVGCGIGVFVEADFVDRELKTPQPGLNSRIIASIARSESVVLDYAAIAAGNAGSGLDFVNLYGTWREDVLDADELAEVQTLLGTSFVEAFAGYRFNRVLKEAIGRSRIELARATRTYRLIAEFPEHDSALAVVSPASAREAPYSLASRLYRYQVPVLRLRPAEQSLLNAALDGKTDAELSAALGLSVEAVKKRWLSIFGRIDQYRPELLAGSDVEGARRGPQKRHRVVAYVRHHREELRPFDWGGARH